MAESCDTTAMQGFLDVVLPGLENVERLVQIEALENALRDYVWIPEGVASGFFRGVREDCLIVSSVLHGFDGIPMLGGGLDFDSLETSEIEALLARRTGPGATELARLAELNDQIENWSGSDNDILDQLIRERSQLIAVLAPGVDPSQVDAFALAESMSYEQALFAVTTAKIDELSGRIDSWSDSDNDPILDQLIADRNEQITILTEGDAALTLRFQTNLADGLTATEAARELVSYVVQLPRIEAIQAATGVRSTTKAEELLAEIDAGFEELLADGLEGEELETAANILYLATIQGLNFAEIKQITESQDVEYSDAAEIYLGAQMFGLSPEEYTALQDFKEHFETLDHFGSANNAVGRANGKVTIAELERVVNQPSLYPADIVLAAERLLAQPGLLNRIDSAKDTNDLFANESGFGRTEGDDHEFREDDLFSFEMKQLAFAQLHPLQGEIDTAYQGGAIDGHLSKSDYETFLLEHRDSLTAAEVQALNIVIEGDLFDQTWSEEYKNSLALASALVAGITVTVATGGTAGAVVLPLLAGAAAGGTAAAATTSVINASSDNLEWDEDLYSNTFNGAIIGAGAASAGSANGAVSVLRSGSTATRAERIYAASQLTAEATGVVSAGTFDPLLEPVIGEDNLSDVRDVGNVVNRFTQVGNLGRGGIVSFRSNGTVFNDDTFTQLTLFTGSIVGPAEQAFSDSPPAPLDVPRISPPEIPGQLGLFD